MQKLAKRLSVFMAAIMTLSLMLNFVMVAPAKAATVYPQVQYAQEPQLEYTVGDRVQFNLYTPNYGGRVQYRVVLWQDETKSYKDLWTNTPDRYYDKWMPYGNNIFTLGWVINEPGHYRITIYAKRAGVPNNETYLKGFNCDSYMESDSFVVKAKEVVATPDVASEKAEFVSVTTSPAAINGHASKAAQTIVGKDYELAVKVDKPGVKVMFQIDAPDDSLNKDQVLEAVSGSDNIAKISYKRLYADADYVTAYVAAAPTVRTAMKVYWGVDKILDIVATDEDAANAANGNVKSYKVTLKNPITGERMRDRELLVLVRENIDAPNNAALSTALITNPYTLYKKTTYQRMNNIVTGGLNQETVVLTTNDNGEAVFTVTGTNTKATPVVFFDDDWFYASPDNTQGWGGVADSSQYKPTYSGNDNGRWDATELQVEPATVTFNASTYTFEQTAISDPYTAVSYEYTTGRTYTVTVKDSAGNPYKYGIVNIAISEYMDGVYGTNTNARFIKIGPDTDHLDAIDATNPMNLRDTLGYYKIQATTGSKGTVSFRIASNKVNDMATPIIWVDQDNASPVNGARNGMLEPADPQKLLSQAIFVESAIKSGLFYAELANDDLEMDVDENDDVISISNEPVNFYYKVRNQNGSAWMPNNSYANITYTIQNVGNSPVTVSAPMAGGAFATGVTVDSVIGWPGTVTIPTYQTKTISFRTYSAENNWISIVASGNAKVNVTANANIVSETNTTGAWLAPATAIASWVKTTDVTAYAPARNMFTGTVFGYNLTSDYVIVVPTVDTDSYVKIPYYNDDVYTVSTAQRITPLPANRNDFERQITVDDILTYKYNGSNNNIDLYNADNSAEDLVLPTNNAPVAVPAAQRVFFVLDDGPLYLPASAIATDIEGDALRVDSAVSSMPPVATVVVDGQGRAVVTPVITLEFALNAKLTINVTDGQAITPIEVTIVVNHPLTIISYETNNADPATFAMAGVTGVDLLNLAAVRTAIAQKIAADGRVYLQDPDLTKEEVQEVVDAVNALIIINHAIATNNFSAVTVDVLEDAGAVNVKPANLTEYKVALNQQTDDINLATLQSIIDAVNQIMP